MRRRIRAISPVIATAILVAIAIIVALAFWCFSTRFIGGGPVAESRAILTANTFIGVNQVVGVN
ncbi:MAG: archaellin/type IV pilin N-terminal domain-containing protein, partial [Desulfurococcaceae archaeon]